MKCISKTTLPSSPQFCLGKGSSLPSIIFKIRMKIYSAHPGFAGKEFGVSVCLFVFWKAAEHFFQYSEGKDHSPVPHVIVAVLSLEH